MVKLPHIALALQHTQGARQVVLVGDDQQLPPVVDSNNPLLKEKLCVALFERLMASGVPSTMLEVIGAVLDKE